MTDPQDKKPEDDGESTAPGDALHTMTVQSGRPAWVGDVLDPDGARRAKYLDNFQANYVQQLPPPRPSSAVEWLQFWAGGRVTPPVSLAGFVAGLLKLQEMGAHLVLDGYGQQFDALLPYLRTVPHEELALLRDWGWTYQGKGRFTFALVRDAHGVVLGS